MTSYVYASPSPIPLAKTRMTETPPPPRQVTLGELVNFICPGICTRKTVPWWPPDIYAITATILRRTGGYVRVLELPRDSRKMLFDDKWPEKAQAIARTWLNNLNGFLKKYELDLMFDLSSGSALDEASKLTPAKVQQWWGTLLECSDQPLASISDPNPEPTRSLIALCCVADEVCKGIGTRHPKKDPFREFGDWVLVENELRTLCIDVPRDRIAVLPKQHTPQRGLTLRSLTHNLSLHPATEVIPKWRTPVTAAHQGLELMNILLLPWPRKVSPGDFKVCAPNPKTVPSAPSLSKFFEYTPTEDRQVEGFLDELRRALQNAEKHAERIHAIVFPELSLSVAEFEEAERFAIEKGVLLMAGVRVGDNEAGRERGHNACWFQMGGLLATARERARRSPVEDGLRVTQAKHHRWCLDRNQILQYGLGGRLPASKDCWELSDISERVVEFFTIDSWLTWAVLICEDLARQDPVAEVVRAVGPNMLVALLMDGPQTKERWPARYASVLAEDPGCSVLTLTSLGMSRRTKDAHRENDRSNVIALWRDASYGAREIALDDGHDACVLSLVCKTMPEYTADGRCDNESAHFPVFAGVHSFKSQESTSGGS